MRFCLYRYRISIESITLAFTASSRAYKDAALYGSVSSPPVAILNSFQILDRIDPTSSLEVRHSSGDLAFIASPARIRVLCSKSQVCASARGRHIRYLELIVPLSEVAKDHDTQQRASSGLTGEDSRTVRRGEDLLANVYSHDPRRCGAYGGSREAYFTLGSESS